MAIVREIKEELNLDILSVEKLAETDSDVPDQITHWWRCSVVGPMRIKVDEDEVQSVKWFSIEEIIKSDVVWPSTIRFFAKYIK